MNKLKHRAIYQGKAYELTGFVYEGKTGIRFWYVDENGTIWNQSGTVESVTILRYTPIVDKNDKMVCEGDTVRILYTDWISKSDCDPRTIEQYMKDIAVIGVVQFEYCEFGIKICSDRLDSIYCGAHGYIEIIDPNY